MTAFLPIVACLLTQAPEPTFRFQAKADERQIVAVLPAEVAVNLPMGDLSQKQGEGVFTVSRLDDAKKAGPAMFGKYRRAGNEVIFTPRFALEPDVTYRASLQVANKATLDYRIPARAAKAPPRVVKIYPTTDVLPANHLRFYIYFDRPMRGGKEIFNQLAIVDDKGQEIDAPWLVDEIWDEANNCLILYIHPGRIKWGVLLRELMGPVLVEKRSYSLVVRGELMDREGNKIGKDTIKKFRTIAEDRVRVELTGWKLGPAPKAGSLSPLTLSLDKPIDHRSLEQGLRVIDDRAGTRVEGKVSLGKDEKSWQFTPARPWSTNSHRLDIHPDLEDVAGNTPARPFDTDLKTPKLPPQNLRFSFTPR